MLRVLFFFTPLLFVAIGGPIWLANRRRGWSTWFPAQLLAVFGLVAAIVLLRNGAFGDVEGPLFMLICTAGAAVGVIVAAIVLPRK